PALRRAGDGRGAGPQETRSTQPAADARWQGGSTPDRLGLRGTASGTRPLDLALVSRQTGRVGDRGGRLHRDHSPDAKKNELKPWLKEQWCIPPEADAQFVCAWRAVQVTERRTAKDLAEVLRWLPRTLCCGRWRARRSIMRPRRAEPRGRPRTPLIAQ